MERPHDLWSVSCSFGTCARVVGHDVVWCVFGSSILAYFTCACLWALASVGVLAAVVSLWFIEVLWRLKCWLPKLGLWFV